MSKIISSAERIKSVVAGWKRSIGCLPCEIIVRDCFPLPIPHGERDARWCVFMTNAEMRWHEGATPHTGYQSIDGDAYLGEHETKQKAERAAARLRRIMNAAYDQAA